MKRERKSGNGGGCCCCVVVWWTGAERAGMVVVVVVLDTDSIQKLVEGSLCTIPDTIWRHILTNTHNTFTALTGFFFPRRSPKTWAWARFEAHVKSFFKISVKPIRSLSFYSEENFFIFFYLMSNSTKKYQVAKHLTNGREKKPILGCYSSSVFQV